MDTPVENTMSVPTPASASRNGINLRNRHLFMSVLSSCDIHILIRELSILIRELKHCMLSDSFRRAFKSFELVVPEARAEKPRSSLAPPRQERRRDDWSDSRVCPQRRRVGCR